MAHYFASSVVSTRKARCHLVLKAELFTAKGTGTDSYRVEIQNGTGNFRKKGLPREVNRNFRNEFPGNFEPGLLEILIEWNAPVIFRVHMNVDIS